MRVFLHFSHLEPWVSRHVVRLSPHCSFQRSATWNFYAWKGSHKGAGCQNDVIFCMEPRGRHWCIKQKSGLKLNETESKSKDPVTLSIWAVHKHASTRKSSSSANVTINEPFSGTIHFSALVNFSEVCFCLSLSLWLSVSMSVSVSLSVSVSVSVKVSLCPSHALCLVYRCLSLCPSLCLSVSICLSLCLSLCQSLCLSLHLSVCLCGCFCFCLCVCLCVYLSVRVRLCVGLSLSISASVCLCVSFCVSLFLSVCLCLCLCVFLFPMYLSIYQSLSISEGVITHSGYYNDYLICDLGECGKAQTNLKNSCPLQ